MFEMYQGFGAELAESFGDEYSEFLMAAAEASAEPDLDEEYEWAKAHGLVD